MFKKILVVSCLVQAFTISAYADHPSVVPMDPVHHTPPPVVQAAAPVVVPPINFQLPVVFQPGTVLPTDVTGFRSTINGNSQNQPSLSKEEIAALTAKDPRFQFSGEWILFSADYSASLQNSSPYKPVGFAANSQPVMKLGRIERTEVAKPDLSEPAFMPTVDAEYSKVNDEHLVLRDGAVLVRAGDRPVFVSTKLCDEQVVTRIAGGSIAMVSAFDQHPTILNLTDRCCGAVIAYLPSNEKNKTQSITIKAGQIAEAYKLDSKPTSNLVSTRIDVNTAIGSHCGLLVSQCHYIRALKKFNLVAFLPESDLNRVLKTAAAVQYVRR